LNKTREAHDLFTCDTNNKFRELKTREWRNTLVLLFCLITLKVRVQFKIHNIVCVDTYFQTLIGIFSSPYYYQQK